MHNTQVIILAAGYATRLYPLTLSSPKPLLPIANKPLIGHVLHNLSGVDGISNVHIVSNEKFFPRFEEWLDDYQASQPSLPITLFNDGSIDESDKLGAIGDLKLIIEQGEIDDNIVVVAGDNLFNHSLGGFLRHGREKDAPVLGIYDVGSLEEAKRFGNISINEHGQITAFEEKPKQPKSSLIGTALYYYPKNILPLIAQYITEGNNPDQPGRLVEWLYSKVPFYTWKIRGIWYDIGTKETLEEVDRALTRRK